MFFSAIITMNIALYMGVDKKMKNFKTDIEKCLFVTMKNHPNDNMAYNVYCHLATYIDRIENQNSHPAVLKEFATVLSRYDNKTKEENRRRMDEYILEGRDIVLDFLDILYNFSKEEVKAIKEYKEYNDPYYDTILDYQKAFELYKENYQLVYFSPEMLVPILHNSYPILTKYLKYINQKYRYYDKSNNKTVKLLDVNDLARTHVRTNYKSGELIKKYEGRLLKGQIVVASDIGYRQPNKIQQDAVLSVTKNDCSLSVVADGVGGSSRGELASQTVIKELRSWFEEHKFNDLSNVSVSDKDEIGRLNEKYTNSLTIKLREINDKILREYHNCGSTVVLALVCPAFSIYMNVGDSTVYSYDKHSDMIKELSTKDTVVKGLSYEQSRRETFNSFITNCIGSENYKGPHSNIILHSKGKRVLLSSDGVTDLISEKNFNRMMSDGSNAKAFVNKALFRPDVDGLSKKTDNISAISIDIDPYYIKKGRRK